MTTVIEHMFDLEPNCCVFRSVPVDQLNLLSPSPLRSHSYLPRFQERAAGGDGHPVIPRPYREFYLADHNRFGPVATLHFRSRQALVPTAPPCCREVKEGALFNLDFFQFRKATA